MPRHLLRCNSNSDRRYSHGNERPIDGGRGREEMACPLVQFRQRFGAKRFAVRGFGTFGLGAHVGYRHSRQVGRQVSRRHTAESDIAAAQPSCYQTEFHQHVARRRIFGLTPVRVMATGIEMAHDMVAPDHEEGGAASLQHIFERLSGERSGIEESAPKLASLASSLMAAPTFLGSGVSLVRRSDKDRGLHA